MRRARNQPLFDKGCFLALFVFQKGGTPHIQHKQQRGMILMLNIFKPAPHIERLDDSKMDAAYKRLRLQVFIGIFIGYAGYYLLRKNFAFAIPYLQEQGFSKRNWDWCWPLCPLHTASANSSWAWCLTAVIRGIFSRQAYFYQQLLISYLFQCLG